MEINGLNTLILLVGTVALLWQTLLQLFGKRLIKNHNDSTSIIGILILAYGVSTFIEDEKFITLIYLSILLFYFLQYYFWGVEHTVYTDNKPLLEGLITEAINEVEYATAEKFKYEKKTKFVITGTTKTIELKEVESMLSGKLKYSITLKKWVDFKSKKDILSFIGTSLEYQDDYKRSRGKLSLQLLFSITLLSVFLYLFSGEVLMPNVPPPGVFDEVPAVYVVERNEYYQDQEDINLLNQSIQEGIIFSRSKNNQIPNLSDLWVYYGNEGRAVFIRGRNVSLFVPYSEIAGKSPFHSFLWSYRELFDKSRGGYYSIAIVSAEWHELIEKILDSNK